MGIRIDFCYKNEAEAAKTSSPGFGGTAGKNGRYVFSVSSSHAPQYVDSPNREPFDKLSLAGRDAIANHIIIYEPIL